MSLPAYPEYKDSGIEWLGRVPAHWEVKPLLTCFKERFVKNTGNVESNVLSLSYGRIVRRDVSTNDGLLPDSFETYQVVEPGDTIIRPTDLQNDQTSLRTGLVSERGIITSAYICLEPSSNYSPIFAQRMLHAYDIWKVFYNLGGGVRQGIKFDDLKKLPIPVPPLHEQQAIAAWLDERTGRIDEAVAAQRTLLEQLKEKRRALIAHAVTRGLDPAAPLKDSGIEWLGQVPAHWEVKSIRRLSRVARGASPRPIDDPKYFDENGEYGWVRISDVTASEVYLKSTDERLSELGSSFSVKLQPGALILSIAGTVGSPCISGIKCCIHDGFVYFPELREDPNFLFYIFLSKEPFGGLGKMGTQLNLNTDTVASIVIGLPPLHEQQAIAAYLDTETAKLDTLTAETEATIALLQEHRTALIAEAVTGKIDLRNK